MASESDGLPGASIAENIKAPGLLVVAICIAGIAVVAWSSVFGCAGMRTEAVHPGEPMAEPECVRGFTPQMLFPAAPLLLAGAGVWVSRPWVAWSGAATYAFAAGMLLLSTQPLLLAVLIGLIGSVTWWHYRLRKHAARSIIPLEPVVGYGVLVVGVLAGIALLAELPAFLDPCHQWGQTGGRSVSMPGDGGCQSITGSSETRAEAATRLFLVDGVPIVLAVLVIAATTRRLAAPVITAGCIVGALGFLLIAGFSFAFLVAWPVAAVWIGAGLEWRRRGAKGPEVPSDALGE